MGCADKSTDFSNFFNGLIRSFEHKGGMLQFLFPYPGARRFSILLDKLTFETRQASPRQHSQFVQSGR